MAGHNDADGSWVHKAFGVTWGAAPSVVKSTQFVVDGEDSVGKEARARDCLIHIIIAVFPEAPAY
jgi:hypothetical protein